MNKFLALLLLGSAIGCAEVPAPQPRAACVQMPPPMLVDSVRIGVYGRKQIDQDKMLVIQNIPSVIRFSIFLKESEEWKRSVYESCKDPKAAPLPPDESGSTEVVVPKGHYLDEDED